MVGALGPIRLRTVGVVAPTLGPVRSVRLNILNLVGKTIWHWQFYLCRNGRQILASSKPGEDCTIRHSAQNQTLDVGGLSIPDDLACMMQRDRIEVDLGGAHVVLRVRESIVVAQDLVEGARGAEMAGGGG